MIYEVAPPNFARERKIPLYSNCRGAAADIEGREVSRNSEIKWVNNVKPRAVPHTPQTRLLYPVRKNGPYVRIPGVCQSKYWYTSPDALERFKAAIRQARRDWGLA